MTENKKETMNKKKDPTQERPGRILGAAQLKIQTRQAQRLVYGRRRTDNKNQIIGMLQFGFFVQKIWSGASMDDPYADWYLLKVHDALERGREELAEMKDQIKDILSSAASLEIDIAHSVEPIVIPVQFPNPFGYMGAYLIADYDELVLALLTARHIGLLDRDQSEEMIQQGASIVRRTFMSSAGWKNTGVTRGDFFIPSSDGKAKAEKAVALMGECPPKVMDGSLRSSRAPQIRQRSVDLSTILKQNELTVDEDDDAPMSFEDAAKEAEAMVEEATAETAAEETPAAYEVKEEKPKKKAAAKKKSTTKKKADDAEGDSAEEAKE